MSKNKTDPVELSKEDFDELKNLINDIESRISIAEKKKNIKQLGVYRKFVGVLGEARGLVLLHKANSTKVLKWYGGNTKDFDVAVEGKNGDTRIQIKSSATEKYSFRPLTVKIGNCKDTIEQVEKETFDIIFKEIKTSVEDKKVDYWLFICLSNDKYFLLNKKELINVIKKHYKRHVCETEHPKSYHCYISSIKKTYNPILKENVDSELLDPYKSKKLVFD